MFNNMIVVSWIWHIRNRITECNVNKLKICAKSRRTWIEGGTRCVPTLVTNSAKTTVNRWVLGWDLKLQTVCGLNTIWQRSRGKGPADLNPREPTVGYTRTLKGNWPPKLTSCYYILHYYCIWCVPALESKSSLKLIKITIKWTMALGISPTRRQPTNELTVMLNTRLAVDSTDLRGPLGLCNFT